jgi:hypothetical protein
LFELMDLQERGKVSYNDFCDVIEKGVTLPIERVVRKRRIERGEAVDDDKPKSSLEQTQNIRSILGEIGPGSHPRDLGTVDGMSEIMHRSALDLEGRQLIDNDDTLHLYNEIKEGLRAHFYSFDDLLQKMGRADVTNRAPEALH